MLAVLGAPTEYDAVVEWIRRRGQTLDIVTSGAEGIRRYDDAGADLVLLGLPLPDQSARSIVRELRRHDPRVAIVIVGLDADVQSPIDAFDLGAQDYVGTPADGMKDLLFSLGMALGVRSSDVHLRFLRNKDAAGADWRAVIGESPAMQKVVAILRHVCERTASGAAPTVLLTGETGTGKGLVAKSLHYNSARRSRAFVDINCAAIPSQLLESELFGYEKGAFTDARSARIGLFETADGGTLFLDEIGAMPLDLQAKILTAIEDKQIRRVGGRGSTRVDVQIVAATHADLGAMAKRGQFRADLYHRLNVVAVELPALRERSDDAIEIAEGLIARLSTEYGVVPPKLSDEARSAIRRYAWPGNVRELRNELERILLLVDDPQIRPEHFRFTTDQAETVAVNSTGNGLQVMITSDRCPLDELEREVIRQALTRCRGNVSRAARFLDVSRQTLAYRLKKHGLATSSTQADDDGP